MASIPLVANTIRPPQSSPLDELARIFQIKGLQQQQQAQGIGLQEAQLALADDEKWRSAMSDPNWDGTPEQLLRNGLKQGVGPKSYSSVATGLATMGEAYAKLGSEQLKTQQALSDHVAEQLQSVQDAPDEDKLAAQQQAKHNAITYITSTPGIHPLVRQQMLQGIQRIPDDQYVGDAQIDALIGQNKLHSAIVDEGLKSAQTTEAAGKASQANAAAAEITGKSNPQSPLYSPTPAALSLQASQGNGGAQAIQAGEAAQAGAVAGARSKAELPAEIEKIHAQQGMLGPELANVPPHLVSAATGDATKAGQEYAEAQSAANDMKTFVDLARAGNKVAYAYSPVEGVLTLNTGRGVKRVNMSEIASYGGAGSAFDRVSGFLGKQLTGASVPADVLDDMESLHGAIADNASTLYKNKLNVINAAYHSKFQPVTLGQGGSANAGGPPSGATHTAPGSDGKMHYTNASGQDLGVVK